METSNPMVNSSKQCEAVPAAAAADEQPLIQLVEEGTAATSASRSGGGGAGPPRIVLRTASGWSSRPWKPTRLDATGCWLVRDACGLACLILAWAVMLYAELTVLAVVLVATPSPALRFFGTVGFHCLMGLALVAHFRCAFSDPGAVPLNSASRESILRLGPLPGGRDRVVYKCGKCSCVKPDRTHHCSVCGRCVRRMDHHCPWINNCVGLRNQKYFVLFTGYISLASGFAFYLCLHHFAICLGTEWEACMNGPSPHASSILLLILIILSLMFGIFTTVMACSQVSAILSNTTGIEKIKGEQRAVQGLSSAARLEAVFGYPCSWRWLSPLHSPRLRPEDDLVGTFAT